MNTAIKILVIFFTMYSSVNAQENSSIINSNNALKSFDENQKLEGRWVHKSEWRCGEYDISYSFRNDSLITYHNAACEGFSAALYKYRVENDTIIATELARYLNMGGFLRYHYWNRQIGRKYPLCWFEKDSSCLYSRFGDKLEYRELKGFGWAVSGRIRDDGNQIMLKQKTDFNKTVIDGVVQKKRKWYQRKKN